MVYITALNQSQSLVRKQAIDNSRQLETPALLFYQQKSYPTQNVL